MVKRYLELKLHQDLPEIKGLLQDLSRPQLLATLPNLNGVDRFRGFFVSHNSISNTFRSVEFEIEVCLVAITYGEDNLSQFRVIKYNSKTKQMWC